MKMQRTTTFTKFHHSMPNRRGMNFSAACAMQSQQPSTSNGQWAYQTRFLKGETPNADSAFSFV
ncbi:MAG: hypothetical protein H7175_07745 [Burkholderiales bacterium]|nr:hypothetical protein [Anaerolineae bacterium]